MHRFLRDESLFMGDSFLALCDQFDDRLQYEVYYSQLQSDDHKNEFLRASVAYLFFVKHGDWEIRVPRSDRVIDYATNSFKLVALISIVESLSTERFLDFDQWLKKRKDVFPILDQAQLDQLFQRYKDDFGAIRRCKKFFRSLPEDIQSRLQQSIKISGATLPTIDRFVDLIYQARSGFAHDIDNTTEFTGVHFGSFRGKRTVWRLKIETLFEAFEIGLLNYFNPGWART